MDRMKGIRKEESMKRSLSLLLTVLSLLVLTTAARAAQGVRAVKLAVDATAAPRKLFRAVETIPAGPGPLTLYYPAVIPGEHGPTGPVINLSGLKFTAAGQTLRWRRDPVDMYAFQLDVPPGANSVEVALEFLAPTFAGGFTSGSSTTSHLFVFSWNWLLLYPKVAHTDDLAFDASIRLPAGWKYGTGLDTEREAGGVVEFKPTSLTLLVDSPVLA